MIDPKERKLKATKELMLFTSILKILRKVISKAGILLKKIVYARNENL